MRSNQVTILTIARELDVSGSTVSQTVLVRPMAG